MSKPERRLSPGESIPWFTTRSVDNPHYHFGTVAGRHVLLLFVGRASTEAGTRLLGTLLAERALFDDVRCSLFVVSCDPADQEAARDPGLLPGVRFLFDLRGDLMEQLGVAVRPAPGELSVQPMLLLLDPCLRVIQWYAPQDAAQALHDVARQPLPLEGPALPQAPVLMVPRVFEPAFCRQLIAYYEVHGGTDSGYMRHDPDGIRGVIDYRVKRRSDCLVEDEPLRRAIAWRVQRRLCTEIQRVFRFEVTRMERYLVACYDGETGGYFRPHRDNDGSGHRQFAVTLNLNTEDYEGGDLRFPEYGQQTYRAPTGGACVFSCALMHEATPVTRGRRYAFVPFLYDEAAAARREANNARYPDPAHHYFRTPAAQAPE